jgi:hypothetical protein
MTIAKILVCAHKNDKIYQDSLYTPIQTGKAISNVDLGYIGDDTGDNISAKNHSYSELTAQYWAWKNLNVEYIGLCHYRRYFKHQFTIEELDDTFKTDDIILSKPFIYKFPVANKMLWYLSLEEVCILFEVLKKVCPEYKKSIIDYLYNNNKEIRFNMFFCKKDLFDKFAEWQFSILFELEKHIHLSPYTRQKRIFGYVGEFLLPIYCLHNNLKINYSPIVEMIGSSKGIEGSEQGWHRRLLFNVQFRLSYFDKKTDYAAMDKSVAATLINDGILPLNK